MSEKELPDYIEVSRRTGRTSLNLEKWIRDEKVGEVLRERAAKFDGTHYCQHPRDGADHD